MGRSRSRSRSRSRGRKESQAGKPTGAEAGELTKAFRFKEPTYTEEDNDALKAVKAAIATLPGDTQESINNLFTSSGLSLMDLDVKAIVGLAQLHVALQKKVMQHLEQEKVFLCNSRSKARFLSSACERAKQGALDVRGFGAIDPWKNHLNALAQRVPKEIDLMHEDDWLEKVGKDSEITFVIDCQDDQGLMQKFADGKARYAIPLVETAYTLKKEMERDGATIPVNKMKLLEEQKPLGWLKDKHTFAHYNMTPDREVHLLLEEKVRGGAGQRRDFSVMAPYPRSRPHIAQLAGMKTPSMMMGKAPAPMMNLMAKMPGMASGMANGMNPMMMMAKMAPLMAKMMAAKGINLPS